MATPFIPRRTGHGSRLRRRLACGAVLALAATIAPATAAAASNPDPTAAAGDRRTPAPASDCSLARATVTPTATVDTRRGNAFTAYGNTGGGGDGWSGGDSTYSAKLSGGRLAWIFSDTFLGPVGADGSRPTSSPFINNSIVIESTSGLSTVHGGTAEQPDGLVPPTADGSWYWFGAGITDPSGSRLDVTTLQFSRFGDGPWDWGWNSNHLVRFDTTTWEREVGKDGISLLPLPSAAGVQWTSWIERSGPDLLVYGVEDLGAEKYLHLAEVVGGDLADLDSWRYWTGSDWSAAETDSARILDDVANEMSVTRFQDGYLAVTQDTSVPFSAEVRGYVACSPAGPFTDIGELYRMPEVGPDGSYGDPNVITYNAHLHPELQQGHTVYLTYNVNSLDNPSLYSDATIYRPRFVKIDLDVRRAPLTHG